MTRRPGISNKNPPPTIEPSFQKGSPFLEDANELIRSAMPMGLLDLDKTLQNATKCGTWHDIKGPCINDVT